MNRALALPEKAEETLFLVLLAIFVTIFLWFR